MELSERCIAQLEAEGFVHIYEWQDAPNSAFTDHQHSSPAALYVTEGTVIITQSGVTHALRTGDRLDIPSNTPYATAAGPTGCQYVLGERIDDK